MKIKDCPFDNLQRCEAFQGCETQFHEGVALLAKVLPKEHVDRIKAEGNNVFNANLIEQAIDTLKQRCKAQIEGLRKRLEAYDAVLEKKTKTNEKKKGA